MAADRKTRDISTPFLAAVFVVIGAIVIWDTTTYTDADSYVFPRTVAIAMIALSVLLVLQWLIGWTPGDDVTADEMKKSVWRRVLLVVAMLGAGLAMPFIGFPLAGAIAFAAILLAAMYDPWTPYRLAVYPVAGAVIVFGFYMLFSRVLQVPLPTGAFNIG